jgi:hypothetical protein
VAVLGSGVVSLAICAYQLSLPHVLWGIHGADDGVHLTAALRLPYGDVPYRDFAFLDPPGLTWLMATFAGLAEPRTVLGVARVATALVTAANASLAALVLRSHGFVPMLLAGLMLAVCPLAVAADNTVTPEPFAVFFCLLGLIAMFPGGHLAQRKRLILAGASLGFAGSIRPLALVPAAVALALCLPRLGDARRLLSGLVVGVALPCVPFLVLAPGSFLHDVLVLPLTKTPTGDEYASFTERIVMTFGLGTRLSASDRSQLAWIALLGVGLLVVEAYVVGMRRRSRLAWLVLGAAAAVLCALVAAREFDEADAYFAVPFTAMLVGVSVGGFNEALRRATRSHRLGDGVGRIARLGLVTFAAFALVATALSLPIATEYVRISVGEAFDPGRAVAARIPEGACVVFDTPGPVIAGNRFIASKRGCPPLADPFVLWLTENNGVAPPAPAVAPAFTAHWRAWLKRADYALLWVPQSSYVPWTRKLKSWFDKNYELVFGRPGTYLYRHVEKKS